MDTPDWIEIAAVKILEDVRAVVAKGWVKGAWAMHGNRYVDSENPEATRFCLMGAVDKAYPYPKNNANFRTWDTPREFALEEFCKTVGITNTVSARIKWNDHRNRRKQDVLDALDETISRLKAK